MIFSKHARLPDGWVQNLRLGLRDGKIDQLEIGATAQAGDVLVDTLLPALSNLHSHSFQRAMAGMTEFRAAGKDSFWTWRSLMYHFMDRLTPEQITAFAALTFMEMLEAGYASVGEFHYVHHQTGGAPYDTPAELSLRIFEAAELTGIGLTHLPVLYSYGGAGRQDLTAGQRRFGNDLAHYQRLVQQLAGPLAEMPRDTHLGIAPHSLRATCPQDLQGLIRGHTGGPVHIHIAEQTVEVDEITDWLGARPVAWLLDNMPVDREWCLIHATHLDAHETTGLAQSGAVAGLCPITESNLGDGIFDGAAFVQQGGRFGIGSDSNIRIALGEELRTLEYSQRLRDRARNVMIAEAGSLGEALYLGAATGGAQALGRNSGAIALGHWADLLAIDSHAPALCALAPEQLLDGLCFAAGDGVVSDVWSAGRHNVRQGRHVAREAIVGTYRQAIGDLMAGE